MTSDEYGQYIDDFELGADVMPGESLTDYIERRRREFESKADGGAIGIEVLFTDKEPRTKMVSGGFLKGIGSFFKAGKDKIDDIIETKAMEKVGFRSRDDIPLSTYSEMKGPIKLSEMENIPEDQLKKILRTQELGLYKETPEILKAANLLQRFTKKVDGKRVIDYERAEDILGVKLKGNETLDELFKIEFQTRPENKLADGGRVGLFMGGPPLEGQALSVYDSMNKYGFSDQEIADALSARGLYTPGGTKQSEQVTGIINKQIQTDSGGGGDGPPPGPKFNRNELLGTSDYFPNPPIGHSLKMGLGSIVDFIKSGGIIGNTIKSFANKIFKPRVEKINQINIDAVVREKARQEKERADFLAAQQRTNIASQLGGPDGTSGGKYAGGAAFASANPYGGSGTENDMGADTFYKDGGLATRFKPRRR